MKSCGMQLAKYLLFGFNLLFALSGLLIVIVGAVVLANINDYSEFMESRVVGPPIVLIVAGLIVFIIAFLGCWGAFRENCKMLIAYAVLLGIIFAVEFAVGVTAAAAKEDFGIKMEEAMKKSLAHYNDESIHKTAWDSVQKKLECCGVHDYKDWIDPLKGKTPDSCCKKEEGCKNEYGNDVYNDGCYYKLREKVKSGVLVLAGVGIGIAFIELAGIVLALLLVHSIRSSTAK